MGGGGSKVKNTFDKITTKETEIITLQNQYDNVKTYIKSNVFTVLKLLKDEDLITLDYLKNCHEYHENWLGKMPAEQCLVLDANVDFSHTKGVEKITNFVGRSPEKFENILYLHLCEILDFMDGVAKRIQDSQVDVNEIRRADIFGW